MTDKDGVDDFYRVVWVDPNCSVVYSISLDEEKKPFPFATNMTLFLEKMNSGDIVLTADEPIEVRILNENNPSESEKKAIETRERHWKIVKDICREPEIFLREKRGEIVQYATEKYSITKPTVYALLRRYWCRGVNKLALTPDFDFRGSTGIRKSGELKRGRPSRWGIKGININEDIQEQIKTSLDKYYYQKGKHGISYTLRDAYHLLLRDYYGADVKYDENQCKIVILDRPENCPTLGQFLYWYRKSQNLEKKIRTRKGDKEYEQNYRPVLGSSVNEAFGPGSKFQIDAMVGDVYLASSYNLNWIIGRPVIYLITDVYSRMIVGIYIGLEGPSWMGMSMALANASSNKVAFCAEYGINITEAEWPCSYLPSALLGDNGELRGCLVHPFIQSLGVTVENAPAYRPDWKGIVENKFRMVNLKVTPFLPGAVLPREIGGGRDYRLDATLTIEDFYKVMIHNILRYNKSTLDKYPLEAAAVGERVRRKPIELWNWGCRVKGGLQVASEDIVKLNLMPTKTVKITGQGIIFRKGLYYTCQRAIKEKWFIDAAVTKKSRQIVIAYDPRNMNKIYWKSSDGRGYDVCNLIPEKCPSYANKSLYDIIYSQQFDAYDKERERADTNQQEIDYMARRDDIISKALDRKKKNLSSVLSEKQKVKDIKINRKLEKEMIRTQEAFLLGEVENKQQGLAQIIPISKNSTSVISELEDEDLELLRRLREEARHDE